MIDKISFVMPAYNCSRTIEEAINSIMQTNFENGDEVIIVNDYSTDKTRKIIKKLQNKYPEISLIDNPVNKGCPASRNVGITKARNSLIFNIDSDNVLAPNSIKKLKEHLIQENADIAVFTASRYFEMSTKIITHAWLFTEITMRLADILAGTCNQAPGGNYLYTKASWKKIGGYWEYGKGLHEAWGFTLKQLANGAKIVVLPNSFYFHRYGHDSLFVTESRKTNESGAMATMMILHYLHLLLNQDAKYIQNNIDWFDNLSEKPIRLKTGEIGMIGQKVVYKRMVLINRILRKLSKIIHYKN